MGNLTKIGNAVFLSESALSTLFENVDPQYTLFEGMTVDQLVKSANKFRNPQKNYRVMRPQADTIWQADPTKKELTATFYFKASSRKRATDGVDQAIDLSDAKKVHTTKLLFGKMEIIEADPKDSVKHPKLVPMFIPIDPSFDVDAWMDKTEDNFDSHEDQYKAMLLLFKIYYVSPVSSSTDIAVRCSCLDYHYYFFKANKQKGVHFGMPTIGTAKALTGTGKPANPDKEAGYCAHLQYALEMVSADRVFWKGKARISGLKDYRKEDWGLGDYALHHGFGD